ncbi:hypothetical protein FHS56_001724 [Thermonema lapsum]|uniref:Uncharacterized protein n=1 Tax=Thermonema lapsum TaxID=28195 RepID=A0A846MS00_9BACT|nr:hypothetical protein [Thermonema lapsum]
MPHYPSNLGTAFLIKGDIHSLTVFTQGFGKIDLRQANITNFYTRHNDEGDILVAPPIQCRYLD